MKIVLKKIISKIVSVDVVWNFIIKSYIRLRRVESKLLVLRSWDMNSEELQQQFEAKRNEIFFDRKVLHGPFKGMRYNDLLSCGSPLYPKLLGSYEKELHDVVREIVVKKYTSVVDVGCAEGFYAVGLGMKIISKPKVFAYDLNPIAVRQCQAMAKSNGVDLQTGSFCDPETLLGLDLGNKSLIVLDCEGYEEVLCQKEVLKQLSEHDFLIEVHDFININLTNLLSDNFESTHEVNFIESVDDIIKVYTYQYEELEGLSLEQKLSLIRENRPGIMRWIYATSRHNS